MYGNGQLYAAARAFKPLKPVRLKACNRAKGMAEYAVEPWLLYDSMLTNVFY